VAYKTLNLLIERRALLYEGRKAYWVWSLDGRVLVIFDPEMVDLGKLNDDFAHKLSTRLKGRLVVRTNSRGLFFQVDPEIPPAAAELAAKPLNLAEQPSPYHMPIGSTERGDLWVSLLEGDSFFVVGMRGMGKTGALHGMIQALLHGGQTLVHAWDGKDYAEFLRYVGRNNFTLMPANGLRQGLEAIQEEVTTRMRRLAMSGKPNLLEYNAQADEKDRMLPIALVIDEVAEVEDQVLLLKQVKVNRAVGVHPIFATNDASKASVIAKSNLVTRISFKVAAPSDSVMGLGKPGANRLPALRGRGLVEHNGRMVEFQSFLVDYPEPSAEGMQWLTEQLEAHSASLANTQPTSTGPSAPEERDPEILQVLALIGQGETDAAIVRKIWKVSGGTKFYDLTERVKSLRSKNTSSSSTSSSLPGAILGAEGAV
jgi:hypothetical protein